MTFPTQRSTAGKTVLLADDNYDTVEALAMLLASEGHTIVKAVSGLQAVDRINSQPVDAAFLDIGMPDLSGYNVAHAIRNKPWGTDTLLVAVTGWIDEARRSHPHARHFDHFLIKPASIDDIRKQLARTAPRR